MGKERKGRNDGRKAGRGDDWEERKRKNRRERKGILGGKEEERREDRSE